MEIILYWIITIFMAFLLFLILRTVYQSGVMSNGYNWNNMIVSLSMFLAGVLIYIVSYFSKLSISNVILSSISETNPLSLATGLSSLFSGLAGWISSTIILKQATKKDERATRYLLLIVAFLVCSYAQLFFEILKLKNTEESINFGVLLPNIFYILGCIFYLGERFGIQSKSSIFGLPKINTKNPSIEHAGFETGKIVLYPSNFYTEDNTGLIIEVKNIRDDARNGNSRKIVNLAIEDANSRKKGNGYYRNPSENKTNAEFMEGQGHYYDFDGSKYFMKIEKIDLTPPSVEISIKQIK